MTPNYGTPTDPTIKQNATNLEEIAIAVKRGHWTNAPMFWMTLVILLLTGWMAYTQYATSQTQPSSSTKTQNGLIP